MDKGEWSLEKIAGIVIILIVLVLALVVYPGKIYDAAKTFLGFGEGINIQKIDENAYDGFGRVVQSVVACRESKKDVCGCAVVLDSFYKTHKFVFTDKGFEMRNVREKTNTLMGSTAKLKDAKQTEGLKKLNCYYDKSGQQITSEVDIRFDEKGAYLDEGSSFFGSVGLKDDTSKRINDKLQLYKNKGELCWILNSYDVGSLVSCV